MTAEPLDEWADDYADEFTPDELTLLHRAVRAKVKEKRKAMEYDRRRDLMHFARAKAESLHEYACLLLKLDAIVPEDER